MELTKNYGEIETFDRNCLLDSINSALANNHAIGPLAKHIEDLKQRFLDENDPLLTIQELDQVDLRYLIYYASGQLRSDMTAVCNLLKEPTSEIDAELSKIEERRKQLALLVGSTIASNVQHVHLRQEAIEYCLDYGLLELISKAELITLRDQAPDDNSFDERYSMIAYYYLKMSSEPVIGEALESTAA